MCLLRGLKNLLVAIFGFTSDQTTEILKKASREPVWPVLKNESQLECLVDISSGFGLIR